MGTGITRAGVMGDPGGSQIFGQKKRKSLELFIEVRYNFQKKQKKSQCKADKA